MYSNEPRARLGSAQLGDKVRLKGDPGRRVFEVKESPYAGYIDLWLGPYRVVTAAPDQEIEFVTT